jgi:arylsulfatase A-like enzyme
MVQWKGRLPAGKVDDRPIIQLDILPTALAAAGVEPKPEWKLDGVNLLPYLTGEKAGPPHAALYWRFGWQFAVRMGDWKLVKGSTGKGFPGAVEGDRPDLKDAELYNLARDIGEQNNLAAGEPERVKQLAAAWAQWDSELIAPLWYHPQPAAKKAQKKNRRKTN